MKKYSGFLLLPAIGIIISLSTVSCKPSGEGKGSKVRNMDSIAKITSNSNGAGRSFEIEMIKGKAHNHPTFAIWLEDTDGKYIQTLFVTQAIGQGIFNYGDKSGGTWKPGEVHRPSALPYWAHKRGVKNEIGSFEPTPKNKVPDAYSGATPTGSFKLNTRADNLLKSKVKLMLEINQPWDWNEYWNNTLYTDDLDYKSSCQPALIFSALVDFDGPAMEIEMKPVGHSHYSGKNGELYTDLSTLTTALHIAEVIKVTLK